MNSEYQTPIIQTLIYANGVHHCYQLDLSIHILEAVGWYFSFLFKF